MKTARTRIRSVRSKRRRKTSAEGKVTWVREPDMADLAQVGPRAASARGASLESMDMGGIKKVKGGASVRMFRHMATRGL